MRYRTIQEYDRRDPIRLMCRALAVSAAGYDAWRTRAESARAVSARTMLSAIRVIHRESRETYGSPSIWKALVKQGHRIGEHRVARLMRQDGIRAKTVKRWRATTQSNHRLPVAENTLNRQFMVTQPNRVWAGDLTMALANRNPQAGLLHHSDRGSQGGFKWSLQHLRCWPIGASGQTPLQAFSHSAFYGAWH